MTAQAPYVGAFWFDYRHGMAVPGRVMVAAPGFLVVGAALEALSPVTDGELLALGFVLTMLCLLVGAAMGLARSPRLKAFKFLMRQGDEWVLYRTPWQPDWVAFTREEKQRMGHERVLSIPAANEYRVEVRKAPGDRETDEFAEWQVIVMVNGRAVVLSSSHDGQDAATERRWSIARTLRGEDSPVSASSTAPATPPASEAEKGFSL